MDVKYIVVLTQERSGSHALWNHFLHCPQVGFLHEPLNPDSGSEEQKKLRKQLKEESSDKKKGAMLRGICELGIPNAQKRPHQTGASIFLMIIHCSQMRGARMKMNTILEEFRDDEIVLLHRKDGLAQYLSWETAKSTNIWHAHSQEQLEEVQEMDPQFPLDPTSLFSRWHRKLQDFYLGIAGCTALGIQPHILFYEDVFLRKDKTPITRLYDALGLIQPKEAKRFIKQAQRHTMELLSNYTKHKHLLETLEETTKLFYAPPKK